MVKRKEKNYYKKYSFFFFFFCLRFLCFFCFFSFSASPPSSCGLFFCLVRFPSSLSSLLVWLPSFSLPSGLGWCLLFFFLTLPPFPLLSFFPPLFFAHLFGEASCLLVRMWVWDFRFSFLSFCSPASLLARFCSLGLLLLPFLFSFRRFLFLFSLLFYLPSLRLKKKLKGLVIDISLFISLHLKVIQSNKKYQNFGKKKKKRDLRFFSISKKIIL